MLKFSNISNLQTLATLVSCSEGDLRKAITYLQCAARLKAETNCIKSSDILEIAGVSILGLIDLYAA